MLKRGSSENVSDVLIRQFDSLHSQNLYNDTEIEIEFYSNLLLNLETPIPYNGRIEGLYVSPSSASKCTRELFYKIKREDKTDTTTFPYQKRWTRNSSAVHQVVQKDILYFEEYLKDARLVIARDSKGMPLWEENIKKTITVTHKGEDIRVSGMMDGILQDNETGELIGFEFKTKSNSIGQLGDYKLKEPAEHHIMQCVLYSIMFKLDTFILMYENVVKDYWSKGSEAKPDIKAFTVTVTEDMRVALLDRFHKLSLQIKSNTVPAKEQDKCLFCSYKEVCQNG